MMVIKNSKMNFWSKEEIDFLIENYSNMKIENICKKIKRTKFSIYIKANKLKLKSNVPHYKENNKGYLCRGYRRINVKGKKYDEHRLIWEQYFGKIPKNYHIHHKDGNKSNNDINNLEMIKSNEHMKIHNKRKYNYKFIKKEFEKGLTHSEIMRKYNIPTSSLHRILVVVKE